MINIQELQKILPNEKKETAESIKFLRRPGLEIRRSVLMKTELILASAEQRPDD